jgi:hypothetical protein
MANATPVKPKPQSIKVRAIAAGYIGDGPLGMIYRNPGDVFTLVPREIVEINPKSGKAELDSETNALKVKVLSPAEQFSANWMEVVPHDEPERLTTAQQEINRQVADIQGQKS